MRRLGALDVNTHWSDVFEEVDEETFTKYIDEYHKRYSCGSDMLNDWNDFYDFSISSGKHSVYSSKNAYECMIARMYVGAYFKFYLRKDR